MRAINAICKLKIHDAERQIAAEKEIGKNIDEITPAKFTVNSAIEKKAADALVTVKAELQKFYETFNRSEEYEGEFVCLIECQKPTISCSMCSINRFLWYS